MAQANGEERNLAKNDGITPLQAASITLKLSINFEIIDNL